MSDLKPQISERTTASEFQDFCAARQLLRRTLVVPQAVV